MKTQNELKTPPWLREVMNVLETAESFFPEFHWMNGDWPAWVQNVAREFFKALFPVANLKREGVWESGEVAAIIGHKIAYCHFLMEFFEAESKRGNETNWDEMRRVFGPDIRVFVISAAHLLQLFPIGKRVSAWKMSKQYLSRYLEDPEIMIFKLQTQTHRWWQ